MRWWLEDLALHLAHSRCTANGWRGGRFKSTGEWEGARFIQGLLVCLFILVFFFLI